MTSRAEFFGRHGELSFGLDPTLAITWNSKITEYEFDTCQIFFENIEEENGRNGQT